MKKQKRHLGHFTSYRYLLRLVTSCIAFLLIPCVLMLYSNMRHSYYKMREESASYYLSLTQNFADLFVNELNELIRISTQINYDSRISGKEAYALAPEYLMQNPYFFSEAADAVSLYSASASHMLLGVYYPDQDWLITNAHKYSAASFLSDCLEIHDDAIASQIQALLMETARNPDSKIHMYSLFSQNHYPQSLLVTVSTYLGNSHSPSVLLYQLDRYSLPTRLLISAEAEELQFGIYDGATRELLLASGEKNVELCECALSLDPSGGQTGVISSLVHEGRDYTVFTIYDETLDYYYAAISPYDKVYHSGLQYFHTMQFVLGGSIVLLLVLLMLSIFISYKPVYFLFRKLTPHTGEEKLDEINTISTAIDTMTDELNELNNLLKDYFLENILCGKPVSDALCRRIGIDDHSGKYRVYALSRINLNTEERAFLVGDIKTRFQTSCFITDILMENITVVICLLPEEAPFGLTGYLKEKLSESHPEAILREGSTVDSVNTLRESWLSCRPEEAGGNDAQQQRGKNTAVSEKTAQLAQDILAYLQKNFCDPALNQASVADHFSISIYTLSRLFKNQFGFGFAEFISSQRVEYARQLLLTTDCTISQIAQMVGLPNANYFSKLFKASTGVSPSKYRDSLEH